MDMSGADVEQAYLDIVRAVRAAVEIPLAVKLSPYFSNTANMAKRLCQAGSNGLVLFNRFYQPDINIEELEVQPNLILSAPQDQRLPLTWIGPALQTNSSAVSPPPAASTVPKTSSKMLMAGADVTMLVATLLRHGIGHIKTLEDELIQWLQEHEYESLDQLRGSMSQQNSPNPSEFERVQYIARHPVLSPDLEW